MRSVTLCFCVGGRGFNSYWDHPTQKACQSRTRQRHTPSFLHSATARPRSSLPDRITLFRCGRVDTVVNAGIYCAQYNGFKKLSIQNWMNSIGMNLHAQFHLLHHFVPQVSFLCTHCSSRSLTPSGSRWPLGLGLRKGDANLKTGTCGIRATSKGDRQSECQGAQPDSTPCLSGLLWRR